jgi:magnesium transporter
LTVTPETPVREVIQIFEKYDLHTLPVVSPRMELLGRIMIDDVLDAVQATAAHRQAAAAGVDESEDLFAPPTETVRHRLPWLGINLLTAVAASAVIALFETSIAQLTTLAILMPIVASMGGNATTQTQTVIIRGLALGQITKQNAFALLKKEFMAGGYLGTILALVMAVAVGLLYSNWMLALVIGMATIANHLIAALGGWVTPLILRKYNYDPAIATGVITTTFTDVGGFFVFLGLASILLL